MTYGRPPNNPSVSRRSCSKGGVSIEYALLGAFLGLGIIAALVGGKASLNSNFDNISYQISKAVPKPAGPPRVVASTSQSTQTVNGITQYQTYTNYTDGTMSMFQTNNNNAAAGWKTAAFEFDTKGNVTSLSVTNPNGTPQYSALYEFVRAGVFVDTITDSTGVPYSFQETTTTNGPVSTQNRVMTVTNGRTDLWQSQTITTDYSNPQNVIATATCQYAGGRVVSC